MGLPTSSAIFILKLSNRHRKLSLPPLFFPARLQILSPLPVSIFVAHFYHFLTFSFSNLHKFKNHKPSRQLLSPHQPLSFLRCLSFSILSTTLANQQVLSILFILTNVLEGHKVPCFLRYICMLLAASGLPDYH